MRTRDGFGQRLTLAVAAVLTAGFGVAAGFSARPTEFQAAALTVVLGTASVTAFAGMSLKKNL